MILTRLASVLAAASLLSMAAASTSANGPITAAAATPTIKNPIQTAQTTYPANAMSTYGCYQSPTPEQPWENHGPYDHQSRGNCQFICIEQKKNVMAVSDGVDCWCGDLLPSQKVNDSLCDTKCAGTELEKCGGLNLLWVQGTGQTLNKIPQYIPSAVSSSASSATATASATNTSAPPAKSNTVAIAIGVVVGVVVLIALGVGAWLFVRRKRQRQAEEDYRRNAANVNQFVGNGKSSNSSMNDSRLDPSFMDRRQSNGSIADNEDYSRRILKVTNA